jgi:hypothetical protein
MAAEFDIVRQTAKLEAHYDRLLGRNTPATASGGLMTESAL